MSIEVVAATLPLPPLKIKITILCNAQYSCFLFSCETNKLVIGKVISIFTQNELIFIQSHKRAAEEESKSRWLPTYAINLGTIDPITHLTSSYTFTFSKIKTYFFALAQQIHSSISCLSLSLSILRTKLLFVLLASYSQNFKNPCFSSKNFH